MEMLSSEETFGSYLRAARKAQGLSIAQMNKKIDEHPATLSRWETNKLLPKFDKPELIQKIASGYKIDEGELRSKILYLSLDAVRIKIVADTCEALMSANIDFLEFSALRKLVKSQEALGITFTPEQIVKILKR